MDPLLWNIAFDDILKEEVPPGVSIICYANDTLVVTVVDDISMLEQKVNTTLKAMTHLIELARMSLATTKTEVVLFTHCLSSVPPPRLLLPKGGADKALYSSKVFGVVVR